MDEKRLLEQALQLPAEARAALAAELIESLDEQVDSDAEAVWAEEIRRRVELLRSGQATTIPWSIARRRILSAAGLNPDA